MENTRENRKLPSDPWKIATSLSWATAPSGDEQTAKYGGYHLAVWRSPIGRWKATAAPANALSACVGAAGISSEADAKVMAASLADELSIRPDTLSAAKEEHERHYAEDYGKDPHD